MHAKLINALPMRRPLFLLSSMLLAGLCALPGYASTITLELPPSPENPRNSEGDFIELNDQRLLFVYTHFSGGNDDHDGAVLAARVSVDHGQTWSKDDRIILENEGAMNVMSVSLLRLRDGRIALFYLRKNATDDCMPYVRFSDDEAETWSEPTLMVDGPVGYYVMNNDRVVELKSGRLVAPCGLHAVKGAPMIGNADIVCFLSDDAGATWQASSSQVVCREGCDAKVFQEPGVVETSPNELLMFIRTGGGSQYFSRSTDGGDHWTAATPGPLPSPVSPATLEKIPGTETLLAVWNDHTDIPDDLRGKRTPLVAALSDDGGNTWHTKRVLEDDPNGWYCYTAMHFDGDYVLLGYCAGDRRTTNGLALTRVRRIPLQWFYAKD